MKSSCIIDNWSLFLTTNLLNNYSPLMKIYLSKSKHEISKDFTVEIEKKFASLSNLINAIIFYENIYFLENGNEITWNRNNLYLSEFNKILKPKKLSDEHWENYLTSNIDQSAELYFLISRSTNADLFLSPQRSEVFLNQTEFNFPNVTNQLLSELDKEINNLLVEETDLNLKVGIESNQILPSFTQLVFNEISDVKDVFAVAQQFKNSDEVINYKNKVHELIQSVDKTKDYMKIRKDFRDVYESTMEKLGIKKREMNNSLKVAFNLYIFKISDIKLPFSTKIKFRNKHLMLLKDLVKVRLEMFNSKNALLKTISK